MNQLIEYETPKVVTVHNPIIGLLRRALQLGVVLYVCLYQLWYAQGYQQFAVMESSVTTKVWWILRNSFTHSRIKVKGHSVSSKKTKLDKLRFLYERVWDEADYVVPPAENGAFFVTTNVVITPNQTLGHCPEVSLKDFFESWRSLQCLAICWWVWRLLLDPSPSKPRTFAV